MSTDTPTQEQIVQYLRDNPELLAQINVPHPYSGQAISIGERQVMLLRDRARNLENKLKEFIQFAEENDSIGEKMHHLSLGLMRAQSLAAVLESLYLSLGDQFAIPHVALRIWSGAGDLPEFAPVGTPVRELAGGLGQPQCGGDAPEEIRAWFGEAGGHLRSFALTPLRDRNVEGLLVMASEDAARFYPEMGTLYLNWLGELASAAIARFA
ncbi:DUF484 family protein [Parasulfuritortus cantonensis]|uniref:DUF484 family protein n=1 Tax=Parasulfuritortus cantonensis TaxID=2528202 RepID=A0A4R1B3Z9_9PROT|nr:DUF484 family protein [Parasulfuritortus cantonensis]TCJ12804.1 DUF484 family protein [Parasulfuritortus cantonensis]